MPPTSEYSVHSTLPTTSPGLDGSLHCIPDAGVEIVFDLSSLQLKSRYLRTGSRHGIWDDDTVSALMQGLHNFNSPKRHPFTVNSVVYGKNEVLAAYIEKATGCILTPKQVSSKVQQVLRSKPTPTRPMSSHSIQEKLKPLSDLLRTRKGAKRTNQESPSHPQANSVGSTVVHRPTVESFTFSSPNSSRTFAPQLTMWQRRAPLSSVSLHPSFFLLPAIVHSSSPLLHVSVTLPISDLRTGKCQVQVQAPDASEVELVTEMQYLPRSGSGLWSKTTTSSGATGDKYFSADLPLDIIEDALHQDSGLCSPREVMRRIGIVQHINLKSKPSLGCASTKDQAMVVMYSLDVADEEFGSGAVSIARMKEPLPSLANIDCVSPASTYVETATEKVDLSIDCDMANSPAFEQETSFFSDSSESEFLASPQNLCYGFDLPLPLFPTSYECDQLPPPPIECVIAPLMPIPSMWDAYRYPALLG